MQSTDAKDAKLRAERKAPKKEKEKKEKTPSPDVYDRQVRNSSIRTTGKSIDTICGPIEEWDCCPENLPHHPTLAFFGKRRTGKSTTMTNILYHCCQNIPFGLVMSDTAYAG